jgi:AcrR family transcriptional regulator
MIETRIEARRPVEAGRSGTPEDTRERILTATRDVIGRKGKRGATTREIAEVAGVN